jgi:hypothetical protein
MHQGSALSRPMTPFSATATMSAMIGVMPSPIA